MPTTAARLACVALLAAAGCAGDGTTPGAPDLPPALASAARTRIAPGQTGLEVITWQVTDDGRRFDDALLANAAQVVAPIDELALRRNGFVVWAVRADRLEALRGALGGSPLDVHTWLGTATTWRELVAVPVPDAMVEVDGVARERPGAQARLMARSWPVPMEDGTRIAVQVVPQLVTDAAQASLVRNANRLSGEVVRSCAIELELVPGVAWAISCDPGGFVETDAEAAERVAEQRSMEGPPAPGQPPASGKIGSRVVTLGAATLLAAPARQGLPARRTVLLLVPHLDGSAAPEADANEPIQGD
jgi:hypothetical protein